MVLCFQAKEERTLNAKCWFVRPGWRSVMTHREAPSTPSVVGGSLVIVNWRVESGATSIA
jgi:hypothetical protein